MAQIIEVDAPMFGTRLAYMHADPKELAFKAGDRVQPADYYDFPSIHFEFVKRHEPGEPGWRDGGYECRELVGSGEGLSKSRAFYLDALILYPEKRRKSDTKITIQLDDDCTENESEKGQESKTGTIREDGENRIRA